MGVKKKKPPQRRMMSCTLCAIVLVWTFSSVQAIDQHHSTDISSLKCPSGLQMQITEAYFLQSEDGNYSCEMNCSTMSGTEPAAPCFTSEQRCVSPFQLQDLKDIYNAIDSAGDRKSRDQLLKTFSSKGKYNITYYCIRTKAYVRDVNSPSWKPTLKLGHDDCKETTDDRYKRLIGRIFNKHSSSEMTPICVENGVSSLTDHCDSGAIMNESVLPSPPDTDGWGTFCQTDENMSTLTKKEEKMLREELNRLIHENRSLKEKVAENEMTLDSLKDQDDTIKYFTGLVDFVALSQIFHFIRSELPYNNRRALSKFQAFMLTLIHIRLNTPLQHLAYIFCISRSTASKVFHETIHVMYHRLSPLVFWPDRKSIRISLPAQFRNYPWQKVVSIIDCFEIFIERPSSPDASALTWSNYKHNNTIKYLISITPQGHISFISKGWGGRTSDKKLTQDSGYLNNLLPSDIVLADRGFDIADLVAMQGAEVKIPAFTRGKSQLSALEIESTMKLAHLRIHVERVIGMVCSKYTILSSTIPTELLFNRADEQVTTLDKIVAVSCALVNMCPGIISKQTET